MTERPGEPRARTRRAVRTTGAVGLAGVATFVAFAPGWVVPMLVVTVAATTAVGALAWLRTSDVLAAPGLTEPVYERAPAHVESIARTRRSVVQATIDAASYEAGLKRTLTSLADERLRATEGITMSTHPDAARARLGEELWQRLTTSSERPPTEAEVRRLVSALDRVSPRS
jgi:hypothetical protein